MLPFNFGYSSTKHVKINAKKLLFSYYHPFSLWLQLKYSINPFSNYTFCLQTCFLCPDTCDKEKKSVNKLKLTLTKRILKTVIR